MMTPRQPFQRLSWLDQFVRRFQDRWETSPQYRSLVLGLAGLVLLLALCACTGLLAIQGNNLLSTLGLTNSTNNTGINTNTGTGSGQQAQSFPTATFGPFSSQVTPPGAALPNSQTPLPDATATTTDNPNGNGSPTPTGGGGGNNTATFVCTGGNSGVTWTFSPCPLVHGQAGTLTISAPKYANAPTNILVSFGNCTQGSVCTVDDAPPGFNLNASGVETISFTVPNDAQVGGPEVSGLIGISGGPQVGIHTAGSVT